MEESIVEFYIDKLKAGENPITTLVNFYKSAFEIDSAVDSSIYGKIGKLIRLYGAENIFNAILSCTEVDNTEKSSFDSIYGLVIYFAKKRVSELFEQPTTVNLTDIAKKNLQEMEKKRKLKIPEDLLNE